MRRQGAAPVGPSLPCRCPTHLGRMDSRGTVMLASESSWAAAAEARGLQGTRCEAGWVALELGKLQLLLALQVPSGEPGLAAASPLLGMALRGESFRA